MVRRLLSLLDREIRGLHEAAYLLALFALLSQLLALLRDRTFAHVFGAGLELDMYFAAFRVPDLVFAFLTIFVSSFALIPLLTRAAPEVRRDILGSVLSIFGVFAILVSGALFILMPIIVPHLFPGFSLSAAHETIALARVMLLQPIFLGLSAIAASWVQATRKFILFALAPIFYNVGIIIGVLVFYPSIGLIGLAWGVVLGAALHLVVQATPLIDTRVLFPKERMRFNDIVRNVIAPSVPRSLSLMANQSLLVAFASVASLISQGSIAAHTLAWNLSTVPVTVLAVSYASALFPSLSELYQRADRVGFIRETWVALRHLAFWLLPATMFLIVLRAHAVRIVLGTGAFSWDDTRITAAVVALFALSLLAQATVLAFSRAYYAAGKVALPIMLNVGGALLAGALAYVFVVGAAKFEFARHFIEALLRVTDVPGTLVLMIPFAYSLVMITIALCFAVAFSIQYGYDRATTASLGISFSASVIGAAAVYGTLNAFGPLLDTTTFVGIFVQGATAGLIGTTVWVLILYLMRSQEFSEVYTMLRSKLARS